MLSGVKKGDMFLDRVAIEKREEVERARAAISLAELANRAATRGMHSLVEAIERPGISIIAEIKKRSPSAGDFGVGFSPRELARIYESSGAAAISVLTDSAHFGGSMKDLEAVREATHLPILRKDFIVDEYQIYETKAHGGDACLLIAALLDGHELARFYSVARGIGLDALVEVHDEADLEKALSTEARLIGINCRDLRTLDVDQSVFYEMLPLIPKDRLVIAESGISEPEELRALYEAGIAGALIGSALMRSGDPRHTLSRLVEAQRSDKHAD